jgi:hypothetical protein
MTELLLDLVSSQFITYNYLLSSEEEDWQQQEELEQRALKAWERSEWLKKHNPTVDDLSSSPKANDNCQSNFPHLDNH